MKNLESSQTPEQFIRSIHGIDLFVAGVLLASSVGHLAIWLIKRSSLSGPVSLRKPILFGLSGGLTLLSVAWLRTKLRSRPFNRLLFSLAALALLVEVGLITLQQWRGKKFNSRH